MIKYDLFKSYLVSANESNSGFFTNSYYDVKQNPSSVEDLVLMGTAALVIIGIIITVIVYFIYKIIKKYRKKRKIV